jgi:glycosyl transferase family 25
LDFDAVKFETIHDTVWLARRGVPAGDRNLHRLGAEHLGAAAYMLSRRGALQLLATTRAFAEVIDHSIFGRCAVYGGKIVALQLVPAIAVQDTMHPDKTARPTLTSTLHEDDRRHLAAQRRRDKPRGPKRWRSEARRVADQIRRWLRLAPSMHRRRVQWK